MAAGAATGAAEELGGQRWRSLLRRRGAAPPPRKLPPGGPEPGTATLREALLSRTVMVAALGYFVETYDLLLFTVVRVQSLESLGVPADRMLSTGVLLLNAQMAGLLLGGLLWGVLADRRGRVAVLFGSIALYSVATLFNAFVPSVEAYVALRFIAGVGLAGELGTAITLISEVLSKEHRAYGTTLVGVIGLSGAIFAAIIGTILPWQHAFVLGGAMGLGLLVMRYKTAESGLFDKLQRRSHAARGSLRLLFQQRRRATKYLGAIVMGAPTWFVVAIVVTFSPEVARSLGVTGPVTSGMAIIAVEIGLIAGNITCAILSQRLRTRWWTILGFVFLVPLATLLMVTSTGLPPLGFYALVALLGGVAGYRVLFLTMAGEQFGTNLRATVVTTAANFSRASTIPLTLAFTALIPVLGIAKSTLAVGAATCLIALLALRAMEETFGRDLDYVES